MPLMQLWHSCYEGKAHSSSFTMAEEMLLYTVTLYTFYLVTPVPYSENKIKTLLILYPFLKRMNEIEK